MKREHDAYVEFLAFCRLRQDGNEALRNDAPVAVSNLSEKNMREFMATKSRHAPGTHLCVFTHDHIVGVLKGAGWEVEWVDVPTHAELLAGHLDPGETVMKFTHGTTLNEGWPFRAAVKGARRPKERLSRVEWVLLRKWLDDVYNMLGVRAPAFYHRLRKKEVS